MRNFPKNGGVFCEKGTVPCEKRLPETLKLRESVFPNRPLNSGGNMLR